MKVGCGDLKRQIGELTRERDKLARELELLRKGFDISDRDAERIATMECDELRAALELQVAECIHLRKLYYRLKTEGAQ